MGNGPGCDAAPRTSSPDAGRPVSSPSARHNAQRRNRCFVSTQQTGPAAPHSIRSRAGSPARHGAPPPHVSGISPLPVDLAAMLDALPVGVALLDIDCSIRLMNRALETLTGFTTAEVRGIPCRHALRASICLYRCPLRRPLTTASGVTVATASGAHYDMIDDGELPPAQEGDILNRHRRRIPVRMSMSPLRDADGRVVGWLHAVEDLTLVRELEEKTAKGEAFGPLVGRSVAMERVFQALPAVAQNDGPLLVTGETGTGKDTLAEAVHKASSRAREPFVKASLSSLPEFLAESELFGHRKGAFPGAEENKPGRFRLAQGGTLYLTEIGDLPLSIQGRLLAFLDEGVIYPVGATDPVACDVRLVVATNRDPEQLVAEGRLREDLFRRLSAVRLHLPPLRDRGEDIEFLLNHFMGHFAARMKKTVRGCSGKALRTLLDYPFPGNVRELRNIAEYAVTLCHGETVMPAHLPAYLFQAKAEARRAERERRTGRVAGAFGQPGSPDASDTTGDAQASPGDGGEHLARTSVSDLERRLIADALQRTGNRRGEAAELLGWGRSTLWRKMKQYGMC
ncbi:sigma-54-dependent Fis family transcriptional regulator [Desulfovibrio oxamicus]|uniref:Sigma-54-dependent Fis family transcriptional regulator n=1 Tax=Nitratidesulfovibrio oxamicus TaxID=32016 RepID=A0ABS0J2E6_9BACT|nr:sigma-54-dependent Fis family transcriptional regulator [Nitratidesulfovibrio oxamicus]